MSNTKIYCEELEATLRHLHTLLGPHDDVEQVVIKLAYDVGMRARAKLLAAVRSGMISAEFGPQLERGPIKDLSGQQVYELDLGGIRLQWLARRIPLGSGRVMYV